MSVKATDKGTGKEQSITITGASTLPKDEVEKMVQEAEANADLDQVKREEVDIKNQADSLCYQSERQLEELGDKVDQTAKNNIEEKIKALREEIVNNNTQIIKDLQQELQTLMMDLGKKAYAQPTEDSQNVQKNDKKNDSTDAIDTEFSETK